MRAAAVMNTSARTRRIEELFSAATRWWWKSGSVLPQSYHGFSLPLQPAFLVSHMLFCALALCVCLLLWGFRYYNTLIGEFPMQIPRNTRMLRARNQSECCRRR